MKRKQIFSLIIAAAIPLSLVSCSFDFVAESDLSSEAGENQESAEKNQPDKYSYTDLDTVKEHIASLEEHTKASGNEKAVAEDIDTLINDLDTVSEALSYITIDYYCDWKNDDLEAAYDSCYEDFYVMTELLHYGFSNAYTANEYSSMLEDYVEMDYLEYFTDKAMSVKRLEGYARVDYEIMDEALDEYYELAYSMKKKDKEKNLAAAEIYLDILSTYDTETFYEIYNRDYTPQQILELSKTVQAELIPAGNCIKEAFKDIQDFDDIYDNPVKFDNEFEIINKYTSGISDKIAESSELLCDKKLYTVTEGDNCYSGSFTTDLPIENSAIIYVCRMGNAYDMLTAIHEFGHFYASFYDDTPSFLVQNNIDIAEIQSQGMEMLFLPYYDEIYGKQAEAMEMFKVYDMVDSVISGFLIGEFEYSVLSDLETMTPEKVVKRFDSLMSKYGYETNLYYISHIFEQPGYYISYGVSALAALDIWNTAYTDEKAAVEMYEKIAEIKCKSEEYQFGSALESCGFNDVLSEKYIKQLADNLKRYAEKAG